MLRRNARLRREYIYRKSVELRNARLEEKKQELKESLKGEEDLPSSLKAEALQLHDRIDWDEAAEEGLIPEELDDEYRWAGVRDPAVVITTSRNPAAKVKSFAKELRLVFPNATKINRGNYELRQIVSTCRSHEVTDLVLLNGTRNGPSSLVVSHLPHGPTAVFTLHNVRTREELAAAEKGEDTEADAFGPRKTPKPHMPQEYPHLSIRGFDTKSPHAARVISILKHLFPVPKEEARRIIALHAGAAGGDAISFRQFSYRWAENAPTERGKARGKTVALTEHGPRFELLLYKIFRGAADMAKISDIEFVQRPYMNTARKRLFVAEAEAGEAVAEEADAMITMAERVKRKKKNRS